MSNDNKMLIDAAHPEETRVVVLRDGRVEEFDFESAAKKLLRGNIYLAKVTRVEPSLQAAFIDYGGNRHGFLAFNEIHPDYYQIPVADRQALLAAEAAAAKAQRDADDEAADGRRSRRPRSRSDRPRQRVQSNELEAGESGVIEIVEDIEDLDEPTTIEGGSIISGDDDADQGSSFDESDEPAGDDEPRREVAANAEALSPAEFIRASEVLDAGRDFVGDATPFERASPDASGDSPSGSREFEPNLEAGPLPGDDAGETGEPSYDDVPGSGVDQFDEDRPDGAGSHEAHDGHHHSHGDSDAAHVDSTGGDDAAEEMPERRRRSFRHYKIQEVIRRRQILLVQVVKEERGNKGAALTTYLSLAGRYTVLMPNTDRGGGISRKITNAVDRKRLKEIANELEVPAGMGLIIRTAGASRSKAEIKRDFEYLMRLWETVRDLTLRSVAPALVYEEGDLIKRSIRDLYTKEIEDVVVAGDAAFQDAREFMRMLMPSHAHNVHHYKDSEPLFARYQIERQLNAMYSPYVTLKSGGYIVINQTEALVSIDVNSGKATREHNIEDTALKTNLEASDEIARQLRLRDLAGLIVIDFIDMEERRNNRSVEKRLKDALRNDRARIQVGRISHFGLMEMSRQRLRTGVLEGSTTQCPHCLGTGVIRSTESVALSVLRALEDSLQSGDRRNITATTSAEAALYILNVKRAYVQDIEARHGVTITIAASDRVLGANFTIEKQAAVKIDGGREPVSSAVQLDWGFDSPDETSAAATNDGEGANDGRGRKRRRRRGRGGREDGAEISSSGNDRDRNEGERRNQGGDRNRDRSRVAQDHDPERGPVANDGGHGGRGDDYASEPVDVDDVTMAEGEGAEAGGGDAGADGERRRSRRRGRRGGRRNRRGDRPENGSDVRSDDAGEHAVEPASAMKGDEPIAGLGQQPDIGGEREPAYAAAAASVPSWQGSDQPMSSSQPEAALEHVVSPSLEQVSPGRMGDGVASYEPAVAMPQAMVASGAMRGASAEAAENVPEAPALQPAVAAVVEAPAEPAQPPKRGWWQRRILL